jgi:acylglycerol lipase
MGQSAGILERLSSSFGILKNLAAISLPALLPTEALYRAPLIEFVGAADDFELAYRHWPGTSGHCVVLYLHGIEGHSQWFENTASVLNERGMTIYAFDRRGSGLNSRDRGHMTSYKVFLDDNEILLERIADRHKGQPLVLMGNCWGAKAAAIVASHDYRSVNGRQPVALAGLILTNPAIKTKVDFDLKTKLKIAYYSLRGDRHALKRLPIPLTTDMLTDNPTYVSYIEEDPLRLTEATAQFYVETFKLTLLAQSKARQIGLPLLILQSGKDQIVDVQALERWYARCPSPKKFWRLFPEAAHSLDFDSHCGQEYIDVLTAWLLERTPLVAR